VSAVRFHPLVRERGIALGAVVLLHSALLATLTIALRAHVSPTVPTRTEARLIEPTVEHHDLMPLPPVSIKPVPLEAMRLPETSFDVSPSQAAVTLPAQVPSSASRDTALAPLFTPPRFDAAYLTNPAPAYPAISRRLRETGVSVLRVRVTTEGQPAEVLLEHTSGFVRLDEAAISTVRRWRFVPARRGEQLAEAWVLVPVEFVVNLRR
jgi:periplasmic protein TonB